MTKVKVADADKCKQENGLSCKACKVDLALNRKTACYETFMSIIKASVRRVGFYTVVNYGRKGLGQTGDGHFSPIAGYNAKRDMILLLDIARFKYPPHWVSSRQLFDAMRLADDQNPHKPRGFCLATRDIDVFP